MKKTIMMDFGDGNLYPYGTYPADTNEQRNRINEIAMRVCEERDCWVRVVEEG